jgi:hypothetical protein
MMKNAFNMKALLFNYSAFVIESCMYNNLNY